MRSKFCLNLSCSKHCKGTELVCKGPRCICKKVTWLVVTEVGSKSSRLVTECLPSATTTHVTCCDAFSSLSVVSCAFSVQCAYSTFGHHPHPLGYLCAKFSFICDLRCWTSPWRKIAYSINQRINQSQSLFELIWCGISTCPFLLHHIRAR